VVEQVDNRGTFFCCAVLDDGLCDGRAWADLTVDFVQGMHLPLLVVGHQGVRPAFVDGSTEASKGTGQRFFPISKVDARMSIVIECGLENGYSGHG
jgi:hypothetical protein